MGTPQARPFALDWSGLRRSAPDWLRDAKFGLFFHWGPYTVPACGNEWYSRNMYAKGLPQNLHHVERYGPLSAFGYKDFYKDFKGERFDPASWAALAEAAGARYAGPVTEHADNFSLWASRVNPANAVGYGPRRDVVGELAAAFRARGLRFLATFHHQWLWGWFMSSDPDADVYDPANEVFYGPALPLETCRYMPWRLPDEAFNERWMRKVLEVTDAYDPDLVYFDSRAHIIGERTRRDLLERYYNGPGSRGDRVICYKQSDFPEGTGVRDLERGRFLEIQEDAWQTDDRLEALVTWCHVEGARYRPAAAVIHQLCDIVSKNGNLLLNVGPRADGTFEAEAVSALHEIGAWLSHCGEAVYGTRPFTVHGEGGLAARDEEFGTADIEEQTRKGAFRESARDGLPTGAVRFTAKGNALYAIVMGRPEKPELRLSALAEGNGLGSGVVVRVDMIGGAVELPWKRDTEALTVSWKGSMPFPQANVIRVTYR